MFFARITAIYPLLYGTKPGFDMQPVAAGPGGTWVDNGLPYSQQSWQANQLLIPNVSVGDIVVMFQTTAHSPNGLDFRFKDACCIPGIPAILLPCVYTFSPPPLYPSVIQCGITWLDLNIVPSFPSCVAGFSGCLVPAAAALTVRASQQATFNILHSLDVYGDGSNAEGWVGSVSFTFEVRDTTTFNGSNNVALGPRTYDIPMTLKVILLGCNATAGPACAHDGFVIPTCAPVDPNQLTSSTGGPSPQNANGDYIPVWGTHKGNIGASWIQSFVAGDVLLQPWPTWPALSDYNSNAAFSNLMIWTGSAVPIWTLPSSGGFAANGAKEVYCDVNLWLGGPGLGGDHCT
jgi:hypothetical protein